jgi:hypothetical protein
MKKPVLLKNKITQEVFTCYSLKEVEIIDGVEFLFVQKPGTNRVLKQRKDALVRHPAPK